MTKSISRPNRPPLEPGDQQKLEKWLGDVGCHCPACDSEQWGAAVGGHLQFAPGLHTTQGGDGQPAILLTCKRCGYLAFFCPFTIGIATDVQNGDPAR